MNSINKNWYDKFKEIESKIQPNDKIHLSSSPTISFKDMSLSQSIDNKPRGLWYACGNEWINFEKDTSDFHLHNQPQYLFKIEINPSAMFMIKNNQELDNFGDTYSCSWQQKYKDINAPPGRPFINWPEVAKKYGGIEICPYLGSRRRDPTQTWYYGWDVASGCIWNKNAIVNIKDIS